MGNVSREMESLRKNQKEMLEIKKIVTEKKMLLMDSLVYKCGERISELEEMSIETSKTEMQRKNT